MAKVSQLTNELSKLGVQVDAVLQRMKLTDLEQMPRCKLSVVDHNDRYTMKLPKASGIYFVRRSGRRGTILYIGKASNLRQRCSTGHHHIKIALDDVKHRYVIQWFLLPTNIMSSCEDKLIEHFQPKWNVNGK